MGLAFRLIKSHLKINPKGLYFQVWLISLQCVTYSSMIEDMPFCYFFSEYLKKLLCPHVCIRLSRYFDSISVHLSCIYYPSTNKGEIIIHELWLKTSYSM